MRTLLLAITIILATTIAKAQQYQYHYTEITIKKFHPEGSFIDYRIDTDHTLTFYVTYIFTNDLNQTYVFQRDKEHSNSDNDNNNKTIKGFIPGKLKNITIYTHCYVKGARKKRVVDITDELTFTKDLQKDNDKLKGVKTHCYNITGGNPRYQIYKALCDIDYKVYEIKTIDQGHDISLCPNSEIRFTSDIPDFYTDKFNIYCNSHLINSKNSTTPTETYKSVNVESFFQYISGTNEPFNLTIEGVFKKDDNDFNDFYKEFYEGEYISEEYAKELTEELKKAGYNFDWDDLMDKFRQLILEGYGVDWNQVILSLEGIFTQQKSTDIYRSFHFNGINDNVQFDKPYIKDNYLVIENTAKNKNCKFVLSGETISQNFDAETDPNEIPPKGNVELQMSDVNHELPNEIPEGKFQLQISDKNGKYCQVNLDAYVPKVEYQYIDKAAKQHTHWHKDDYLEAINIKLLNVNDEVVNDEFEIKPDAAYQERHKNDTDNPFIAKYDGSKTNPEKIVKYKNCRPIILSEENGVKVYETLKMYSTSYYISCYPDLQSIKIEPKDIEHSIYTIISTQGKDKLKEYPPITVDFLEDKPAHCSYDTLKVNIKSITGGLTDGKLTTSFNDFKYQLKLYNTNNEEIPQPTETTTIPKDGIINIPNYNHKEYKYTLQFYDAIISDEDAEHGGKEARSFTTSEKQVVMPEALFIPEPTISRPLCTFDSNGSIAINSAKVTLTYPNESAIYTWRVKYKQEDSYESLNMSEPIINNIPAGFYEVELNNDGCIATSSYELKDYPLLKFESTTSSNAKCYGYSDGSIFISVKGGTGEHRYFWNVGATSKDLLNIPKGDYQLTVWDAHECNIQTDTIKITEPVKVVNKSISHDYSICQDSELEIDAGDFADYEWKDPQGKTLKAKSILTLNNASPEGKYYLKTIRKDKCFAEDFINITQSKESLTMNFLLPSDIYNDDHAKIVETSSRELDSLKWSFSENLIGDFPKDSTTLTISTNALDKLSTYKIKLTGYYKGCISTVTKNLNISNLTRPEEEYIPDFYDSDEILDCRIGPNPNNGNFTLFLDLDCAKDAVLTIYSISSYKYVLREKLVGLQNYEHSINQNLQQGLYILEVKTPKSIRRIKFEVTK
ncbi:MAG: SprB repeat-containing protein [Bacteroidales bacterium]|nr:SprB repeat-containing protein [Bacteroidales bacterium]